MRNIVILSIILWLALWLASCSAVNLINKVTAKPFNNDGICETIVVENGEVISRESYPCE
jgi:hypothetical protein